MSKTLAQLLADARGGPIKFDGAEVRSIFVRDVPTMAQVKVKILKSRETPTQALRIKLDKGTIRINGQDLTEVVLWADTAPAVVEMVCQPNGKIGKLKVWNAWRDDRGTMQAWVGCAGLIAEENGKTVLLRCSDGAGNPDFGDLAAELSF